MLTNHHILMDGWSLPILVRELLALYADKADAGALPRLTPYRDYLAWLARQDRIAAIAAWREVLAGLEQPTRLVEHAGRARKARSGGADAQRGHCAHRDADAAGP